MATIRTDLAVSPSFSRSGKTAASVNAQAMGQLKKELELASRKAARGRNESTLNASHAEILSRVLDSSITGVPPSFGSADVSREKDLCSSPREQTTWCVFVRMRLCGCAFASLTESNYCSMPSSREGVLLPAT